MKFKGPYQCYYMSFVNIGHIAYIYSAHVSQNSFMRYCVCLHIVHIQ